MTGADALMLWQSFLSGEEGASEQLADAYEELGQTDTSKDVRSGAVRFVMDETESEGALWVRRACWGFSLGIPTSYDLSQPDYIGWLDLFYEEEGIDEKNHSFPFLFYQEGYDEPLCKVAFGPASKTRLIVNKDAERVAAPNDLAIYWEGDGCYSFPEANNAEDDQ